MQSDDHDPLYHLLSRLYDRHDLVSLRDAGRYSSDGADDESYTDRYAYHYTYTIIFYFLSSLL